jgi:hypothetical protein
VKSRDWGLGTRTGCINPVLKGHGFSRAVKAASTPGLYRLLKKSSRKALFLHKEVV